MNDLLFLPCTGQILCTITIIDGCFTWRPLTTTRSMSKLVLLMVCKHFMCEQNFIYEKCCKALGDDQPLIESMIEDLAPIHS